MKEYIQIVNDNLMYHKSDGTVIKLLPTIEDIMSTDSADRPQGEWIESFNPITVKQGYFWKTKLIHDGWSCSECSEVVEKRYHNCPYCLARMKGVDNECR